MKTGMEKEKASAARGKKATANWQIETKKKKYGVKKINHSLN